MYICDCCGRAFCEPQKVREERGECHGEIAFEEYYVSPCCHDSFDEAAKCARCGELSAQGSLDCGLCPRCQIDALKRFYDFMESFSDEEREYINLATEGEFI